MRIRYSFRVLNFVLPAAHQKLNKHILKCRNCLLCTSNILTLYDSEFAAPG